METILTLPQTTVGKKAIMAVSGLILFGFVFAHMVGNLQLWLGPEAINAYAASLRKVPGLLWVARAVLLGSVLAHIWAAMSLKKLNDDARPVAYAKPRKDLATTFAAKSMMLTGLTVLLYIIYHIAHLTFGVGLQYDHQNVYNNLVFGFQNPIVTGVYVVANALVALHVFHGARAWFNSLGLNHGRYNHLGQRFAIFIALAIGAGNLAIPTSVLLGIVKPTDKVFCHPELAQTPGECDRHGK